MEQGEQQEKSHQRKLKTGEAASITNDSGEGSGTETLANAEKEGEGVANSHGLVGSNQTRGEEYISAGELTLNVLTSAVMMRDTWILLRCRRNIHVGY